MQGGWVVSTEAASVKETEVVRMRRTFFIFAVA
jgi:hypothetical protein